MKINFSIGNYEYVLHKPGKRISEARAEGRQLSWKEMGGDILPMKRRSRIETQLRQQISGAAKSTPVAPPVPRIDVTDKFSVQENTNDGSVELQFAIPVAKGEKFKGLKVTVDRNGVLSFEIRADRDNPFSPSGTDMLMSAMQRLKQEGIQVNAIGNLWMNGGDSVNHKEYVENRGKGMLPRQAAANTWSGRLAAKCGFANPDEPEEGVTFKGEIATVDVIFRR